MRNLPDLKDLNNVQDVILLMVITENKFQEIQNEMKVIIQGKLIRHVN